MGMTKKQKRTTIFFILLGLLPPLIIVGGFVTYIIIFDTFFTYKETFHKPCVVIGGHSLMFEDNNQNAYSFHLSEIERCNEKKQPTSFFPKNNFQNFHVNSVCLNDDYIFATISKTRSVKNCMIVVFDKSMEEIKRIASDFYIRLISVYDNYLYCVYDSSPANDCNYVLAKYSLWTFERTIINDNVLPGNVYYDGDVTIFLDGGYNSMNYYVSGLHFDNEECYFGGGWFRSWTGIIDVQVDNNLLTINYAGINKTLILPFDNSHLMYKSYIKDNLLILGVEETINNEECVPNCPCVCKQGRSTLIRYDLKNESFLELINYGKGTFLIDFDRDGAYYYFDGGFYNHENLVRACQKLEPNGQVTVRNKDYDYLHVKKDIFYIEYYNGKFYGI